LRRFIAVFNFRFTTIGPLGQCPESRPPPSATPTAHQGPVWDLNREIMYSPYFTLFIAIFNTARLASLDTLTPCACREWELGGQGRWVVGGWQGAEGGQGRGKGQTTLCYNNAPPTLGAIELSRP